MTFQFLNLNHTQDLLNTVYEQFYDQYEANNTTLNLHNIGEHLLCYVRIEAWVILGMVMFFICNEDKNGSLLEKFMGQ